MFVFLDRTLVFLIRLYVISGIPYSIYLSFSISSQSRLQFLVFLVSVSPLVPTEDSLYFDLNSDFTFQFDKTGPTPLLLPGDTTSSVVGNWFFTTTRHLSGDQHLRLVLGDRDLTGFRLGGSGKYAFMGLTVTSLDVRGTFVFHRITLTPNKISEFKGMETETDYL